MGDAHQLRQVIMNILLNAVDFTPSEGKVVAQVKRKGQEICLSISDTGEGVPPENRLKIFEPMFSTKSDMLIVILFPI